MRKFYRICWVSRACMQRNALEIDMAAQDMAKMKIRLLISLMIGGSSIKH